MTDIPKAVRSIWQHSAETSLNWCKRDLVEYIDLMFESARDPRERERLVKIKKRIHQNCSQALYHVLTMLVIMEKGGTIEPFENLLRPDHPIERTQADARSQAEALLPSV